MEAKYIALERAAEQIQWMYAALAEIEMSVLNLAELKGANNESIAITKNKQNHNQVKHIDVQQHFIQHYVEEGKISIAYVPSIDNLADLFTKPLPWAQHTKFCAALQLFET